MGVMACDGWCDGFSGQGVMDDTPYGGSSHHIPWFCPPDSLVESITRGGLSMGGRR